MTISSENYKNVYLCDGSTTVFPYTFKIFNEDEIQVIKYTIADGTEETLTINTDYTVSGAGDADGGNVTTTSTYSDDYKIILKLNVPFKQEVDPVENDPDRAEVAEEVYDRTVLRDLQLKEQIDRAIVQDPTESTQVTFPSPEADKIIGWNDSGDALENKDSPEEYADSAAASASDAADSASAAATSESNAAASASAAATSESNAAASASQAAASAAEGLYNDVVSKSNTDSPLTPTASEEGTLFRIDTSGGNFTVNLDSLSNYGEDMKFAFVKTTSDSNTITINRGGTDTIEDGTSVTLSHQYEVNVLIGDSATGTWLKSVQSAQVEDGSITTEKLADGAVTLDKMADLANMKVIGNTSGSTGTPQAVDILDEDDMASDSNTAVPTQQSVKAYVDDNSGDKPLSNVIFCWSGIDTYNSSTYGLYSGNQLTPSSPSASELGYSFLYNSTSTVTLLRFKFKKISGISTITICARAWIGGSSSDGYINVNIGGRSNSVFVSTSSPAWATSSNIDVSSLTDGTVYDGIIDLSSPEGTVGKIYCSAITLIAS